MIARTLPRELLLWLPVGLIPIVNGAIRLGLYARWLGEPRASLLSSSLDVLAVCAYASLVQRRWPVATWGGAAWRGAGWLALTTLNHFALGALVFAVPLPALVAKYDPRAGELWGLVSLAIFVAPPFGRWTVREAAARSPTPARAHGLASARTRASGPPPPAR